MQGHAKNKEDETKEKVVVPLERDGSEGEGGGGVTPNHHPHTVKKD